MLVEDTALLESAKRSQIIGSKHKEVASRDKEEQQPPKKAKEKQLEKYCGGAIIKIESANSYERYVSARQNCLVHHSR